MDTFESLTLVRDAVHDADEPRHFMQVQPLDGPASAVVGPVVLAASTTALVVREVGFDVYDPVVYFPRADVTVARLRPNDTVTHCPLKGAAEHFDLVLPGATLVDAAWSYLPTVDDPRLRGLIAFDGTRVEVRR